MQRATKTQVLGIVYTVVTRVVLTTKPKSLTFAHSTTVPKASNSFFRSSLVTVESRFPTNSLVGGGGGGEGGGVSGGVYTTISGVSIIPTVNNIMNICTLGYVRVGGLRGNVSNGIHHAPYSISDIWARGGRRGGGWFHISVS